MALSPSYVNTLFQSHMGVIAASQQLSPQIVLAASVMLDCLRRDGRILACGNGGSAADAQHFACELVGRFLANSKPYAAFALTTDPSTMTAIANDFGFEETYARQVQALGRAGDVLLAISTSGNSKNVVRAVEEARKKSIKVIALVGGNGGGLRTLSDICIAVPSDSTPRIQEVHELIIHILCEVLEAELA